MGLGLLNFIYILTFWGGWCWTAIRERVSRISSDTGTRGQMVNHLAVGILTTGSRARVLAFIANTCFVRRAVRIKDTLGSTALVRITDIFGQTSA